MFAEIVLTIKKNLLNAVNEWLQLLPLLDDFMVLLELCLSINTSFMNCVGRDC